MTTLHYRGRLSALIKLGVGVITYAPLPSGTSDEEDLPSMKKKDDLWREFDSRTFTTGEESALGSPSPPKVASDDYSTTAPEGAVGGRDANADSPLRSDIIRSAINESFRRNEIWDPSQGPEPAMTQPYGSEKTALANPFPGNGGQGLGGAGLSMGAGAAGLRPPTPPTPPPALKPPNPMAARPGGLVAPKTMAGAPMSPLNAVKPPSLANPAMNTSTGGIAAQMQSMGAMSAATSPMRRALGNPL